MKKFVQKNNLKIVLLIIIFCFNSTISYSQVAQNMLRECLVTHLQFSKTVIKDSILYDTRSNLYADFYYGMFKTYPQYEDNGFKIEGITIKKMDARGYVPLVKRNKIVYLLYMYITIENDKLLLYIITKSVVRGKRNLYILHGDVISIFDIEYNPDLKEFKSKLLSQGNQDSRL